MTPHLRRSSPITRKFEGRVPGREGHQRRAAATTTAVPSSRRRLLVFTATPTASRSSPRLTARYTKVSAPDRVSSCDYGLDRSTRAISGVGCLKKCVSLKSCRSVKRAVCHTPACRCHTGYLLAVRLKVQSQLSKNSFSGVVYIMPQELAMY